MPLDLRNLVPPPGVLDPDPDTARFTPAVADLEVDVGFVPMVYARIGATPHTWHVIYDGVAAAFSPLFAEHSDIEVAGQVYTLTLLPTGGWWASPLSITYGQFKEAT